MTFDNFTITAQEAVREAIVEEWDEFSQIVQDPIFRKTFGDLCRENKVLQRVPNGFDKNFPGADYLKLNSFYVYASFPDHEVCASDFVSRALQILEYTAPLNRFLNRAIQNG